jgi:hypothetical protein
MDGHSGDFSSWATGSFAFAWGEARRLTGLPKAASCLQALDLGVHGKAFAVRCLHAICAALIQS